MDEYYLVTIYNDGRAYYTRADNFAKAIQICDEHDTVRVQKKLKGHVCSKYVYEKWDGVVTNC